VKKEELEFILENGEGYFVEFKEKLDKSFAHELVAFANASGGQIFLGINDKNIITGIEVSNKLKSQIQDIARNIQPPIEISLHDIRNILIVKIPKGTDKPYHCSDGFYLRMGPNTQKMNRNQIIKLLQFEGKVIFEEQFHRFFDFDKHYNSSKLTGFLNLAGITRNLDDITILENLGLVKNINNTKKIINAGILFFSNNLDILMEQATITCAVFDGNERIKIINRKDFTDDIITNIDNALHFLKQALKVEYIMTGEARRQEVYEIPLQAIREAIVNAVAHRDYFATGAHTTIEIFDDRIEIGNPGGLPKGLSSATFGKKAVRRNPIITNLLQRGNFVENMGTGINKIKKLCFENNIPEPEFIFNDFFTVIFKRHTLNDELNDELNEGQLLVFNYIKHNQGVMAKTISQKLNMPFGTVDRHIRVLLKKTLIERRGSKKTGGYFLIEKQT
jgi:ATP-dependent DNA helicase RecG